MLQCFTCSKHQICFEEECDILAAVYTVNVVKTETYKKKSQKYCSNFLPTLFFSVLALSFPSNRWCMPAFRQYFSVKNRYLKKMILAYLDHSFLLLCLWSENTSMLMPRLLLLSYGGQSHTRGPYQ
jgi:hypothetical protein